jgi:lipopolysaccharide export system protein LptC
MKKAKVVILLSIVLIGGLVFIRVWMSLKERNASEKQEGVPKISTQGADMHLEKIRLVEDKHGQKTWELEAKSIQQYQDQNIMMLEDVKVTFYSKEGQSFTIFGNQGKVLSSSDGYRLKTHSVSYRNSEKKVTTSDPVEIEGELIRLVGKGMLVDMEAKTFKVLSQVKTQWKGGGKG